MNKHYISEELYLQLKLLPDGILISTALVLREQWLNEPSNGQALMGMLIAGEVLMERGLDLPAITDQARLKAAIEYFNLVMNKHDNIFCS